MGADRRAAEIPYRTTEPFPDPSVSAHPRGQLNTPHRRTPRDAALRFGRACSTPPAECRTNAPDALATDLHARRYAGLRTRRIGEVLDVERGQWQVVDQAARSDPTIVRRARPPTSGGVSGDLRPIFGATASLYGSVGRVLSHAPSPATLEGPQFRSIAQRFSCPKVTNVMQPGRRAAREAAQPEARS